MLEILTHPDERLRLRSEEVTGITPELREFIGQMVETMYGDNGIGLAAPQVDRRQRIIVVDITGPEERTGLMVLLNPVIKTAEGETESDEGCLSVPNIRTVVPRAEKIVLTALDLTDYQNGEPVETTIETDGLLAVCLQHEIDHLEGRLIVDHMSRLKRSMYEKKALKWKKREQQS